MDLGAVALCDGRIVGYIQLGTSKFPDIYGLHDCKAGELYIDQIGVSSVMRGMGVGTKLLKWAEEKARSMDGIDRLTLEVIDGNRAIRLYERFGFRVKPNSACMRGCYCFLTFWLVGCPYGISNMTCGSFDMVKNLY